MNDKSSRVLTVVNITIPIVVLAAILYHLLATQIVFQTYVEHQNNHFAFALVLVFLASLKEKTRHWPLILLLMLAGLVATGYVKVFFNDLQDRQGFPTTPDMVIGVLLILIALEASRRAFGLIIPLLTIVFIAYDFLGQYLPPPFYHIRFTTEYIISRLSIGLSGLYSTPLGVSANNIFLFLLFGGILQASQASEFFMSLGKLAGQKLKGGPAQTAVISSAIVGTVTGGASVNVAVTGVFTILLMKKIGYTAEQAGAIEAAASSGGQIMPPVLGAAAFLMAGITGISYSDIMVACLIPAILYFTSIGIYVELQARALNLTVPPEEVDIKKMISRMPNFLVPLIVIVVLLVNGYTPMFSGFWGVISLLVVTFITDFLTIRRLNLKKLMEGFTSGAMGGAQIGVVCATMGFLAVSLTMTGLGLKLPGMVEEWSMGSLPIALVITMFISLLLGMGTPTVVAYLLVAVLVAPALVDMGAPLLQAHLFCFYFAVFSAVTPPVATGALVASGISHGNYFKTGFIAFKICLIAMIIAYLFIYNPTLIMQPPSWHVALGTIVASLLLLFTLGVVITNYFIGKLNSLIKVLFLVCALLLLVYTFTMNYVFIAAGIGLLILLIAYQRRFGSKKVRQMPLVP